MTSNWLLSSLGLMAAMLGSAAAAAPDAKTADRPRLVGHRGLIGQAPENTLAGFDACTSLRLGFELDIRRSKDGHLVCIHDDDIKRTTNSQGKVADLTLDELRKLDAGRWFDPVFAGERVPLLEEVFAAVQARQAGQVLIALDLKIGDETVEADVVRLAKKHGVLGQVVCIGRAIGEPAVRRKLRGADPGTPVAVLAPTADDLPAAVADRDSDWVYVRFLPTRAQVDQIHRAGKRVFLSGPLVSGNEPDHWRKARDARVDAVLTDYPLECRRSWQEVVRP
jgi:glycerophosphoryl diester phosphodiesterase